MTTLEITTDATEVDPTVGDTEPLTGGIATMPADAAGAGVVPALVADQLDIGTAHIRAVSFRGTLHALSGDPRQDAFAVTSNDNCLVLAVADGIGSCKNSHHGARAATTAVSQAVATGAVDPTDTGEILRVATAACDHAADLLGIDPRSLSTTLTVAALGKSPCADGSWTLLLHQVGDSPALVLNTGDGTWSYLTPTDDGPSNVVRTWIPGRVDNAFTLTTTLPAGSILVLSSDGFSVPLGDGTGPLGQDLAARWQTGPRELVRFIVDLSFDAYHDDKTVVALWLDDESGSSPDHPGPEEATPEPLSDPSGYSHR